MRSSNDTSTGRMHASMVRRTGKQLGRSAAGKRRLERGFCSTSCGSAQSDPQAGRPEALFCPSKGRPDAFCSTASPCGQRRTLEEGERKGRLEKGSEKSGTHSQNKAIAESVQPPHLRLDSHCAGLHLFRTICDERDDHGSTRRYRSDRQQWTRMPERVELSSEPCRMSGTTDGGHRPLHRDRPCSQAKCLSNVRTKAHRLETDQTPEFGEFDRVRPAMIARKATYARSTYSISIRGCPYRMHRVYSSA